MEKLEVRTRHHRDAKVTSTQEAMAGMSLLRLTHAMLLALLALNLPAADARKGRGKGQWVRVPKSPPAPTPTGNDFNTVECPKCMTVVMRLLLPMNRGCPMANSTVVSSSNAGRVPTAYCDTLLPKKRACIAYSFGLDGTWDFDKAMVSKGCRVLSFDPLCCGGAHRMGPSHDFIPVGLHTYDGLADSDDPTSAPAARRCTASRHACRAHSSSRRRPCAAPRHAQSPTRRSRC